MLSRRTQLSCAILALAGSGWLVACGGAAPEAKSATAGSLSTPTVTNGRALDASGQQVAVSDAPSSGRGSVRPKLNDAALAAYRAGMDAFQKGDLDGAQAQFIKATEADSNAYSAFYGLGVVRERLGNSSGALSAYGKAITVVPDYEPAIVSYGLLTAREGNADAAEEYINGRLAKMDRSAALVTALAEIKSMRGDSGAAQKLAKEALKLNPDYRPAMITLARDHYRARRLDLALYALQGILDGYGAENPPRDKDNPEAILMRGLIFKERGQRGRAIEHFKRCIELRPDLVEARVQLAGYLLEAGNAVEAQPLLEIALRYDRDNVLAHLNLGDAYRLLGRPGDAKQQLEWVVSKDAKLPQVYYGLGLLYLFTENVPGVTPKQSLERALQALEEYKRLRPRAGAGQADDVDELITVCKSKKAIIEAKEADDAAAKAEASKPAAGAKPAADGDKPAAIPAASSAAPAAAPAASGSATKPTNGAKP